MRTAETASMPVPELQRLGTKQAGNLMPLIIGFRCQISGVRKASRYILKPDTLRSLRHVVRNLNLQFRLVPAPKRRAR